MVWINRLYIFFVGVLLAITTGFGVAALYPEPVRPQYPLEAKPAFVPESCKASPQTASSSECEAYFEKDRFSREEAQKQFEIEMRDYNNRNAGYTRTAIFFGVAVGSFFALAGLSIIKKSRLVANGLLLGGLLTAVLTRFLIHLASFGGSVSSNQQAGMLGYIEFAVLTLLSVAVIFVGFNTLKNTA